MSLHLRFRLRISPRPNKQVYGYAGTYPGGTIEAVVDRPVAVTWRNHLPDTHFLPTEPLGHRTTTPRLPKFAQGSANIRRS